MEEDTVDIASKRGSIDFSRKETVGPVRSGHIVRGQVHVMVVEADSLGSADRNNAGIDPYCKLSLGREKAKTKIIEKSSSPVWKESLSLAWTEGSSKLTIQLHDWKATSKNECLGRVELDLSQLSREVSHDLWRRLEDGKGSLHIILTITAITSPDLLSVPGQEELKHNYASILISWLKCFSNILCRAWTRPSSRPRMLAS